MQTIANCGNRVSDQSSRKKVYSGAPYTAFVTNFTWQLPATFSKNWPTNQGIEIFFPHWTIVTGLLTSLQAYVTGISVFIQGYFDTQNGTESLTFWLVDDPLSLLRDSHPLTMYIYTIFQVNLFKELIYSANNSSGTFLPVLSP